MSSTAVAVAVDIQSKQDPTSQSNPTHVVINHANIQWNVDFNTHLISGSITYTVKLLTSHTITLDTKDIDIKRVTRIDGSNESDLKYDLGTKHDVLGTPLHIHVGDDVKLLNTELFVRIYYSTTTSCSATQWLSIEQTKDKKAGFLFTQCQAIHARTLIPVQDTPGQKFTYQASVTVPAPLTALMSALPVSNEKNGNNIIYHFNQPIPIPSYLLALAVGVLESRQIGPRSHVWSEPSMVEASAFEFSQTEKFLIEAEKLVGSYVWGQYDLLVLPPSFPYGGMENPCMTFVTPTLLAGDRSLESVVAHEAAHSWMGNLVTNHTWRDFWLNEGFTVFLERKIIAAIYGEADAGLHSQGGWVHLQESVDHFGKDHGYTHLVPDLSGGIDPDDVFSSVPYEKGFNLLWYLQSLIGEPLMNQYLRAHVDNYAKKTCTTYEFQQFFIKFAKENGVKDEILSSIPWSTWFFTPGMPQNKPNFNQSLISVAHNLAENLVTNNGVVDEKEGDIKGWNANQTIIFLDHLIDLQSSTYKSGDESKRNTFTSLLDTIDKRYSFSASKNAEIRFRWYTLAIRAEMTSIHPRVVEFLSSVGRMKYVRPLYRDLFASCTGRDLAISTFKQHYRSYHAVAAKMVAKDLGVTL